MATDAERAPLLRATPVLRVADYPRARAFYTNRLGFQLREEAGSPPRFAILQRGAAVLFLDGWHPPERHPQEERHRGAGSKRGPGSQRSAGGWDVYLHVEEVNALLGEYEEQEVAFSAPRRLTHHGTLEFEVTDPDGNVLCFGQFLKGDATRGEPGSAPGRC